MVYGCTFLELKSNEFKGRKERISKLARTSYTAYKKTGIFFYIIIKSNVVKPEIFDMIFYLV